MFWIRINCVLFDLIDKSICKQQHVDNAVEKCWKRCFFAPEHGEGVVERVIKSYSHMSFFLHLVSPVWRPLILHALIFVIKILRILFFTLFDSWKTRTWVAFYQDLCLKSVQIFLIVLSALLSLANSRKYALNSSK